MNKKQKRFRSLLCILLAVLMVLSLVISVIPALAVSQSDIDELEEQKKLLKEQAEEQQKVIDNLVDSKARYVDRKLALDQQIELNKREIELFSAQIEIYDAMIEEKIRELEEALEAEQEQSAQLRSRMRAMEETSNMSYIAILLEASSLTDLLSRAADITDIMHYDKTLEQSYMATRADVEALKADYETVHSQQQLIRTELESKQARLDAQVKAAYELLASIDDMTEGAEAERQAITDEEKRLEEEIDELMAELARQEAAQQAAQRPAGGGNTGGTTGGGGGTIAGIGSSQAVNLSNLTWPTPSCSYITSRFGPRNTGIPGASTYHQGLDIGAWTGASILASASGTVEIAYSYGGYGNCILINHGGGIATLYAHCDSVAVSVGQYVSQGQVIGYVGSTGVSSGPHLHYEVRVNGVLTDPAQYFTGLTYSPTA